MIVYSSLLSVASVASVRLSATVALGVGTPKNCSLCLPRVFDGGGRRKKKLWVQGLCFVVIMDALFPRHHNVALPMFKGCSITGRLYVE